MTRLRVRVALTAALSLSLPLSGDAHMFLQPYTLPVPFWIYLYACAATLVVSFAVVGAFVGSPTPAPIHRGWDILPDGPRWQAAWQWLVRLLRACAVASLLLTIVAGLVGTGNPAANINMTLFWVAFLLGLTYFTAIGGNIYELTNPWKSLVEWTERLGIDLSRSRLAYPDGLGYFPAFAFYVGLIWIELFVLPRPHFLSMAVILYTAATFTGVLLFGKRTWFEYGELFSVFFRTVGTMAPVEYRDGAEGRPARVRLRAPLVAAFYERPKHGTLVVFVLFMLSSTTYDAIHETFFWVSLYWQRLLPLVQPVWGTDLVEAQSALTRWYVVYQRLGLVLSPFFYLLIYLLVLACARRLTKMKVPLRMLAVQFTLSLVPIALVYHATHYYTILITELPKLLPLASDPFGLGWRLFATTAMPPAPLDMGVIWHTQVILMLAGHIAAVYLAHVIALRVLPSQRLGIVSQIPMLVLMVVYTCVGLWVLSLPLATPQVVPLG
jgi:hypothetical protein